MFGDTLYLCHYYRSYQIKIWLTKTCLFIASGVRSFKNYHFIAFYVNIFKKIKFSFFSLFIIGNESIENKYIKTLIILCSVEIPTFHSFSERSAGLWIHICLWQFLLGVYIMRIKNILETFISSITLCKNLIS